MTMDIRDFGDQLIRTDDLDPVYVAIHGAHLPPDQLARCLLAYWCFYHLGVAAWMSQAEGRGYWSLMELAAENKVSPSIVSEGLPGDRWPRMAERRHFRGEKCVKAVQYLQDNFGLPEAAVGWLTKLPPDSNHCDESYVMNRVQKWPLFGPWISFKAADMLERLAGAPILFNPDAALMYEEPRSALGLLALQSDPGFHGRAPEAIYRGLLTYFSPRPAPPQGNRFCGPQEVETVLCKWKSHSKGHYPVGKDTREVAHSLQGWGSTAERMLRCLPRDILNRSGAGVG